MFKRSFTRYSSYCLLAGLVSCPASWPQAGDPTPVIHVDNPPNTPAQQAKHYVILVSLDGFRYDYAAKYGAPHLQAMAKDGASAPGGMLPSYPSLTFPNHLTLVTGLYPEHHGIVANSFMDPSRTTSEGRTYVYTKPALNGDGSWYGGTPLWVLAEQQGMRSACLFWPGSEAEIQGKRPSYYLHYDDKLDDTRRIDQVIAWLNLPPEMRPHFITLYYSNVDHAGHSYGPDSDEVRAAVHHADDLIGDLHTRLAALKLPVDLIVVADHGMINLKSPTIDLSQFADLTDVATEGSLLYAKDEAAAEKLYEQFKSDPDARFSVYRRKDLPRELHYDLNPRVGDPVIVPNGPYLFRAKASAGAGGGNVTLRGGHGFDPRTMPEMKAIFYTDGPDIRAAVQLPTFQNVDVYPFISALLGLNQPIVDGNLGPLADTLKNSRSDSSEGSQQAGDRLVGPVLIHQEIAEYSELARKQKAEGDVELMFIVDVHGVPTGVRVTKGLGLGLDENAVEAVKKWRFKPGTDHGRPVPVEVSVTVNFHIR